MSIRDDLQHPLDMISEVGRQLDDLSYAFATTGNSVMANKLNIMLTILDEAVISINRAMPVEIDGQLNLAQEASANVLRATLAGAEDKRRVSKKCVLSRASSYYHHYPEFIFDFVKYDGNMANIKYFDGELYHGITVPANDLIFVEDDGNNN